MIEGERRDDSLWGMIVNNEDITFTHVLPRLNANVVKFLYEVNTETRKLIKRSSRKGELKKKFRVKQISSFFTTTSHNNNKESLSSPIRLLLADVLV